VRRPRATYTLPYVADPTENTPADADAEKAKARRELWNRLRPEIRNSPVMRRKFGLGDAVAVVAKPVARALGLPEDCLPCQQRQAALNAAGNAVGSAVARKASSIGRRIFRGRTAAK
jgi:hypothetical protein